MNPFTEKIHSHARADSRNIVCSQNGYDLIKLRQNLLLCHNDLRVIASDIVRDLFCVFEVDGIFAHAYCKGFYRHIALFCGNGTDKRGIQTA